MTSIVMIQIQQLQLQADLVVAGDTEEVLRVEGLDVESMAENLMKILSGEQRAKS